MTQPQEKIIRRLHSKDLWVSENSIKFFDLKSCTHSHIHTPRTQIDRDGGERARDGYIRDLKAAESCKNKQMIVTIDRSTICRNFYSIQCL